jgi:hypothetical protein
MTPTQAIAAANCFACLSPGEKELAVIGILNTLVANQGVPQNGWPFIITTTGHFYAYNSNTGLYRQITLIFIAGVPALNISDTETAFAALL